MNSNWSKSLRSLPGSSFPVLLALFLLKGTLTIGSFVLQEKEDSFSLVASEVLAQDRKTWPDSKQNDEAPPDQSQPPSSQAGSKSSPLLDSISFLKQRETELMKKEEQLRQKEEYLQQMEQEVENKLKELITLQKEIQAYRTEKEEDQNARIRSLSKIYGSMKPKEAAKLLEKLNDELVVEVISAMTSNDAASVLSSMDVKKAAKISEFLSRR